MLYNVRLFALSHYGCWAAQLEPYCLVCFVYQGQFILSSEFAISYFLQQMQIQWQYQKGVNALLYVRVIKPAKHLTDIDQNLLGAAFFSFQFAIKKNSAYYFDTHLSNVDALVLSFAT